MNIILDTHTLIWYLEGNKSLSVKAKELTESNKNNIYVSIASLWEMSIKIRLGKLKLNIDFSDLSKIFDSYNIKILPLTFEDTLINLNLESEHSDPFDKIIISQALNNNFAIITNDSFFKRYQVEILW
ncbi:MAG: type II toxin-antitoxin system VapC family toxin [bacterium]